MISQDNKLEEEQKESQVECKHLKDLFEIFNNLKDTMRQSKQLMNRGISKMNDLHAYIERLDDELNKERLLQHYNELIEAQRNVDFFYKFMDENGNLFTNYQRIQLVDKKISTANKILDIERNRLNPEQLENFETQNSRGPYKRYTSQIKQEALDRVQNGETIKDVCEDMGIPKKNLRRWIELGAERKKGGGRKRMDTEMEERLHKWCIDESIRKKKPVSRMQIRKQALVFSKYPDKFKASKGWTDKFVKKFNLRKTIIKKLQDRGFYKQYQMKKQDESELESESESNISNKGQRDSNDIKQEVFESEQSEYKSAKSQQSMHSQKSMKSIQSVKSVKQEEIKK